MKAYAGGGGGGTAGPITVKLPQLPIAFNTPDLVLTGTALYTLLNGERLIGYELSVSTAWDGVNPTLHFLAPGGAATDIIADNHLTTANVPVGTSGFLFFTPGVMFGSLSNDMVAIGGDVPLLAMIDDGSGGNPGSVAGAGTITLFIGAP